MMRRVIVGLAVFLLSALFSVSPAMAHGAPATPAQPVTPTQHWTPSPTPTSGSAQPGIPAQPVGPPDAFTLASLRLAPDPLCQGSGLPVRGETAAGMHWMPGNIPSDTCAPVLPAPYQGHLSLWTIPPGVWGKVYPVDRALYGFPQGALMCNWWAYETRPDYPAARSTGTVPRVGATIRYAPGVLGASADGHLGHVVAVFDNGWILTAEMNFTWRGGGASRVLFRFVPGVYPGITYIY